MTTLKKVSNCWWFDSHSSARRSTWLQSTISELEKKTKGMLNLIEGDGDSFAQRAEIYYRKRPELVNMIEDLYRSYRYLAEQHELLRSEVGSRRSALSKCDSSIQSSPHKSWDSTDTSDYPESEISEVDNPEPEEAVDIESMYMGRNEENEENAAESEVEGDLQVEHQGKSMLTVERQFEKEKGQKTVKSMNDKLMVCARYTGSLQTSPLTFLYSKGHVCEETIAQLEMEDGRIDDDGTKMLCEKVVGDVFKLTSEVDALKAENGTLMAELGRKDEEKRHVIRQLSLTVDILKEENVSLKKIIKDFKRHDNVFEFKKLKEAFLQTGRLFGLTSQSHPSIVAL